MKPLAFSSSSVRPEEDLLLLQPARQTLRRGELIRERHVYLDTPDECLREKNQWLSVLRREGSGRDLCCGTGIAEEGRAPCSDQPAFLWDIPPALSSSLRSRIKMRRLSPRLRAELRIQVYRLEDKRQKTVTRLHLVSGRIYRPGSSRGRRLGYRVIALPLRGYTAPFKRLVSQLRSSPDLRETSDSIYHEGLALLGINPPEEAPYPRLDRAMSTHHGIQRILQHLGRLIEANAGELKDPGDTEFLHQFRTGTRKTRTLLAQAAEIFPRRGFQRFSSFFAWLGKVTGPARDTDVHLLKVYGYDSDWPRRFGDQLAPLRAQLEEQRRRQQVGLKRVIEGQRFRRGMAAWNVFLEAPLPPRIAEARKPLDQFAGERIWKRYRKIRKTGKRLSPQDGAASLHRMRIHFKKLRYLIEFLGPVFDDPEIVKILSSIKGIQDDLGNFNDCIVQASWLEQLSREAGRKSGLRGTLERLKVELEPEQESWRSAFLLHFESFLGADNHALFRRLFKERPC